MYIAASLSLFMLGCKPDPNINQTGNNILEEQTFMDTPITAGFHDTIYIPVYSDIYSKSKDVKFNLTATLSIRNSSLYDSVFIENIDYYDSKGVLVREYLEKTLLLQPMQSIEYVIEEDDTIGGTGANFIVNWSARNHQVKPVFHGVMISTHGQQGISFLTEGVSISRRDTIH